MKQKKVNKMYYMPIYICYYIRLIDKGRRGNFEYTLREILLKVANINWEAIEEENKKGNIFS